MSYRLYEVQLFLFSHLWVKLGCPVSPVSESVVYVFDDAIPARRSLTRHMVRTIPDVIAGRAAQSQQNHAAIRIILNIQPGLRLDFIVFRKSNAKPTG